MEIRSSINPGGVREVAVKTLHYFAQYFTGCFFRGDARVVRDKFDEVGIEREFHADLAEQIAIGMSFVSPLDFHRARSFISKLKACQNGFDHDSNHFGEGCLHSSLLFFLNHWAQLDFGKFNSGIYQQREAVCPRDFSYMICSPVRHFNDRLMTAEIINQLLNGSRLLSVGAGPAFLEKTLVKRFAVPASNVVLADFVKEVLPTGEFRTYTFNMNILWPDHIKERFDYIIFPQAIFVGGSRYYGYEEFLNPFEPNDLVTIGSRDLWVDNVCRLMSRALMFLNPKGQIRATGMELKRDDAWLEAKLLRVIPDIDVYFEGETLVIQKN